MNFWITVKTLNERGKKKKKNAQCKLEWHLAGSRALPRMVSTFIYTSIKLTQCAGSFFIRRQWNTLKFF